MAQTTRNLPLSTVQSKRASLRVGQQFWGGQRAYADFRGQMALSFPFRAGTYRVFQCTDIALGYSYFQNGATKIGITVSQKFLCPAQYYTRFDLKRPGHPRSEYRLGSDSGFAIVRSRNKYSSNLVASSTLIAQAEERATGVITGISEDSYFGLSDGTATVYSDSGQSEQLNEGQAAKVNKEGITIFTPEPTFRAEWITSTRARFFSEPSNIIWLNGRVIPKGESVYLDGVNILTVRTVTEKERSYLLRPFWPYAVKDLLDAEH